MSTVLNPVPCLFKTFPTIPWDTIRSRFPDKPQRYFKETEEEEEEEDGVGFCS